MLVLYLDPDNANHNAIVVLLHVYILLLVIVYFVFKFGPIGSLTLDKHEIFVDKARNVYFYKYGDLVKKDTLKGKYVVWLQIRESGASHDGEYVISFLKLEDLLHKKDPERTTMEKFSYSPPELDFSRSPGSKTPNPFMVVLLYLLHLAFDRITGRTLETVRQKSINVCKKRAYLCKIYVVVNREDLKFFLFHPSNLPKKGDIDFTKGKQIFPEHPFKPQYRA